MSRGTGALILTAAACLGLAAWGFSAEGAAPAPGLPMGVLALAALVLEGGAVRLPGMGFASPAVALYLAAALAPDLGFRVAALLAAGAVLVRTARAGSPDPAGRAAEALMDLLPALAAAAAVQALGAWPPWVRALGGLQAWLAAAGLGAPALAAALPEESWKRWREVWGRLLPLLLASACAGVGLAALVQAAGPAALWLLPALFGLRRGLDLLVRQEEEERRRFLGEQLQEARRGLKDSTLRQDELRQDLRGKLEEYLLLEDLAAGLSRAGTLKETLERVLDTVERLVSCRSAAVFLARDGGLEPGMVRTPEREKVEASALLRIGEPLVDEAREKGTVQIQERPLPGPRLFEGDRPAAAFPLEQLGVLYVGRAEGAFEPKEVRLLGIVAGQAAVAVRSALRQEARQEALRQEAEARADLEKWVDGLDRLLEEARALSGNLDRATLLRGLEEGLERLAPHDSRLVATEEEVLYRGEGTGAPEGLQAASDSVWRSRRALLLEDVEGSRFPPLSPGERSLLVVPMLAEARPVGVLMLGAREPGAFDRRTQELITVFAYQAAAALENARLHGETVEAYRKLQESEAQLVQSTKMAAVGQLAAGVAHELNTPLGAILLALESSERFLPDRWEKAVERLRKASATVKRAQEIIERLLYYSRDARKGRQVSDVATIARDALDLIEQQMKMDGVEVELDLEEVPAVSCNQNEIYQVLTNLLLNARDALVASGRQAEPIVVRLRRDQEDLLLQVVDRGPGIPEEARERVFEPFFTTKEVGEGTGLGLSVSHQIVESHGGALTFETSPEGTTFTVRLPVEA